MIFSVQMDQYIRKLQMQSNAPVTLGKLMSPWPMLRLPVGVANEESDTLLVGHVLDELASRYDADDPLEPLTILEVMSDLGFYEDRDSLNLMESRQKKFSTTVTGATASRRK